MLLVKAEFRAVRSIQSGGAFQFQKPADRRFIEGDYTVLVRPFVLGPIFLVTEDRSKPRRSKIRGARLRISHGGFEFFPTFVFGAFLTDPLKVTACRGRLRATGEGNRGPKSAF